MVRQTRDVSMADTPYPIPASARQSAVLLGDGSTVYGPFGEGWGIFDTGDVLVETRAASPGTDPFIPAAVTIAKTDPAAYSSFTVTFATALTAATQFRVTGDRAPRRELAITKGQALDTLRLERELSAFTVNLQELRRTLAGLPGIVAGDAASQAAAAAADAEAALAAIQGLGVDPTGYLSKAGNLSGLSSVGTARTNLGLGSAATQSSAAFAAAVHSHPATGVTGGIKGFSRNLKTANGASPNSQMVITYDELVVKDGSGTGLLLTAGNLTVTMGAAGLNSLDTGTEANSTWYYLWVVSDGSNVAGLYSLSNADCATLGAYAYKALVGAVRNDGSGNFVSTASVGRRVYQAPQKVLSAAVIGTAKTFQSVSIAAGVPPAALEAWGVIGETASTFQIYGISPSANLEGVQMGHAHENGNFLTLAGDNYAGWYTFDECPLVTPQTLWWTVAVANGGAPSNMVITGFTLPIGA